MFRLRLERCQPRMEHLKRVESFLCKGEFQMRQKTVRENEINVPGDLAAVMFQQDLEWEFKQSC